jgi:transcriptional regulator with XRE-family HTH domain
MSLTDQLSKRLVALRETRGLTLDELAEKSGVSRASLSRIERGETSPTASVLGRLGAVYQVPMADLFAGVEDGGDDLVRHADQPVWTDPETGFRRLGVSPSRSGFKGSMIEAVLPAGATVSYDASPILDLEHHLLLLAGQLFVRIGASGFELQPNDCLRFKLSEGNGYTALGPEPARYILCVITP